MKLNLNFADKVEISHNLRLLCAKGGGTRSVTEGLVKGNK